MADSPIFVVGCPRSGTGMLRDLLRSSARLAIPPESHFIPLLYRGWGDPGSADEARAIGGRILGLATVRRWRLELSPESFAGCRSFAGAVELLYAEFARSEGKTRWGDKTPQYVEQMPLLAELFPSARFLHIYRDGRDVALSWLRRPHGPCNLYSAAAAWKRYVTAGREDGAALGGNYMEVRYETLLAEPEQTMRAVCEFIGEPWEEAMLRPAERTPAYLARPPGTPVPPRTAIDRGNHRKWREAMGERDRSIFETVAGELLGELGYETEDIAAPIGPIRRSRWTLDNRLRTALAKRRFTQFSLADSVLLARAEVRRRSRGYRRSR